MRLLTPLFRTVALNIVHGPASMLEEMFTDQAFWGGAQNSACSTRIPGICTARGEDPAAQR